MVSDTDNKTASLVKEQAAPKIWDRLDFLQWLLVLVVLVGAFLRFFRLNGAGFWLDEAGHFYWATYPIERLIPDYGYNQAPFFYYLAQLQVAVTPWHSEAYLRLPSVFFGIGTIIACYFLGKTLFSRQVGLVTAALAAICPILVEYSQEWRPYSAFVFFSTGMAVCIVLAIRSPHRVAVWLGFCLFTLFNLYTHHDALFTFAACGGYAGLYSAFSPFWQLRTRQPRKQIFELAGLRWKYFGLGLLVILAGYMPGIAVVIGWLRSGQGVSLSSQAAPFTLDSVADTLSRLGLGWGPAFVAMIILSIAGLVWSIREYPAAALLWSLWMGIPFLAIAVTKGGNALLVSERYLIFLVPLYLMMAAAGGVYLVRIIAARLSLKNFPKVRLEAGLLAAALLILLALTVPALQLYYSNPKNFSRLSIDVDVRGAYSFMLADLQPGDVVLTFASASPNSGSAEWFGSYSAYYLRNKPKDVTALIGAYGPYPDNYFVPAFRSKGRLWTLIIDGTDTRHLVERAGPEAKAGCFYKICAIQQPDSSGATMYDKLNTFLKVYGPDNLALTELIQKGLEASKRTAS